MENLFLDKKILYISPILYSCHLRCLFSIVWCRHWKTAANDEFDTMD